MDWCSQEHLASCLAPTQLRAWWFSHQRTWDRSDTWGPPAFSKTWCPWKGDVCWVSTYLLSLLYSAQRQNEASLFSVTRGLLSSLQKLLNSECHQLEGMGVKGSLFKMCEFPLDTPGQGSSPSSIHGWLFTQPFLSLSHIPLSDYQKSTMRDKDS